MYKEINEACKGRLSYTDPNFTEHEAENKAENPNELIFNNILKEAEKSRIVVNIDWLSINFSILSDLIQEPQNEDSNFSQEIEDPKTGKKLTLIYTGKGTKHFRYIWHVFFDGEHLAQVISHTRNVKFAKKDTIKVEFRNHLLYTSELWPFYDFIVRTLQLQYKNISRLDIAIDGMNYLLKFCNAYHKQTRENKIVEFKGKRSINAGVLDKTSMLYQYFSFGKKHGNKEIVIYNKSLEIVKSRKNYIQEIWLKNGLLKELLPLEELSKEIENNKDLENEKTYLQGYDNIFRFELRLKSERIREIKNFHIDLLKTTDGLMSIVKLMADNFFDVVRFDADSNISRCEEIKLIPYEIFEIIPLEKVKLKVRDDLYKTKLMLNKYVKEMYKGWKTTDDAGVYDAFFTEIGTYDLYKWFKDKYTFEWRDQYSKLQSNKNIVDEVNEYFDLMIVELEKQEENEKIFT